ncbi:NAD(P)-dependent oxidoreductase [Sphingomonas daechungensis]|uniref:NAD(P)-dependent oxidoreductase n=1 Tax=Sphingomonas daechungensis TaxID=1176646 RepID=A0ABX6T1E9_9SPHN|nr:NAD-dependent epimerase/dehydratase family protein [Sphingomonas daechungensis]QNP43229.1 NAD(P)-dependent oxidoreductase [Sphingomonas daechungensis]
MVGSSIQRKLRGDDRFRVVPVERGTTLPVTDGPSFLIHAAWPHNDDEAWSQFLDWTLELHRSAAACNAWFVALGSGIEACAEHPGLKDPYLGYARRKLDLRSALEGQGPLSWVRLHFMFGPGEQPSRLLPAAVRAALANEEFVCGSLDRRRRWLHLEDQADFLARFLVDPQPGQWDIAGRSDVSFRDLLDLVGRAVGRKLQLRESDAPAPDSALAFVVPERMAPVVPADAGDPANLTRRLEEYVAQLRATSTEVEPGLG